MDKAGAAGGDPAFQAIVSGIKSCADAHAAADEFSGVVLVERNGRTVLSQAYGMADPAKGAKNRLATMFNTGSIAKMFTATAIGQLVDAGKVRLEDPAGKYLPELQPQIARLTIGQLLNHSSGIGEIIFKPGVLDKLKVAPTARELLPLLALAPIAFEPGTKRQYSNTGPMVAGAVVEAVTGKSYVDYVHENVFRRAGMSRSTLKGTPVDSARMQTRSEDLTGPMIISSDNPMPRRAVPYQLERGFPVGNGYNSAPDLARFARAMMTGKLVSPETRTRLWSDRKSMGPIGDYAYGFGISNHGGTTTVGHGGLRGGAYAEVFWAPEKDWTFVILSNYDPQSAMMISNFARLTLSGANPPKCGSPR
jgi:CubicO group peptidase (beta-lactamase class C family)